MDTLTLGRVALVPRGEYDPDEIYEPLDIVSYHGSSYIVLTTTVGIEPTSDVNNETYMMLASKGDRGSQGLQGQQGPRGNDGITSFNGRVGAIIPQPADYTPEMTGAAPESHTHTKSQITDFPTSMTPAAHNHAATDITSGTLPVERGGTGASTAANARTNLGITPANIGALPTTGKANTAGSADTAAACTGNAATATKLATARNIQTNLGSTAAASFNGTANVTPGVTGTLPIANGGTGATTAAAARNALGLGNTTGALPIANGGTGQTTAAAARNALGLGNTTGALPVANGGTGATTAATALTNLGAAASSHTHAATDITSGTLPVERGGTGATTFTSGAALVGNGTGAVGTRAITNNTATSSGITGSTNLITLNTLRYALNRTTSCATADTNYTTYMARGIAASASTPSSVPNGCLYCVYT